MEKTLRRSWRIAFILSVVGLAMAAYGSCGRTAYADERVLPAGTIVQLPRDGERLTLSRSHFLVERSSVDRANAAAELNAQLTASLMQCSGTLAERAKPKPGWQIATKWTAIGMAVAGAFFAGLML